MNVDERSGRGASVHGSSPGTGGCEPRSNPAPPVAGTQAGLGAGEALVGAPAEARAACSDIPPQGPRTGTLYTARDVGRRALRRVRAGQRLTLRNLMRAVEQSEVEADRVVYERAIWRQSSRRQP